MTDEKAFAADLRVAGRKGVVHIHDQIGANLLTGGGVRSRDLIAQLAAYGDLSEIEVHINSAGGNAWDAIAMHNALKTHKARVVIEVDGLAASAASVIAMSGDTVRMADGAMMMLHNPRVGAMGEASELRKRAEMLDRIRDSIIGFYSAKSGQAPDEVGRMLDEETWLNADEARRLGFVDEVVERPAVAACLDLSGFENVPESVLTLQVKETPTMAKDVQKTPDAEPAPAPVPELAAPPQPEPAPEPTPEPKAELSVGDVQALIVAERKRISSITALCQQAEVPTAKVQELIDTNATMESVHAYLVSHMIAKRPPVSADADDSTEVPEATLKAEYREHCAKLSKIGMKPVAEEDYIRSRKIDAGEIPLGVF